MFWKKKVKPEPEKVDHVQILKKANQVVANYLDNQKENGALAIQVTPYVAPKSVIPAGQSQQLAYDSFDYQINAQSFGGYNTVIFKGYPHLAQLANMPEFRRIVKVLASEHTRKFIELRTMGNSDLTDKIERLNKELDRFNVQQLIFDLISCDLNYGRAQLYVDLKMPKGNGDVSDNLDELISPLALDKAKIKCGSLNGFTLIEPVWTCAGQYNATNPLKSDYLTPTTWFINGKEAG